MGGLNSIFSRGLDGLNINSRSLATASNNLANINTPGYARQQLNVSADQVTGSDFSTGGGAEISGFTTLVSPFMEAQLVQTSNSYGTYDGRRNTILQLENVWSDSQVTGVGKAINTFFNSLSELGRDGSNPAARQTVQSNGDYLTKQFNSMSAEFSTMRTGLSNDIAVRLQTINNLAQQIAQYNNTILNSGGPLKAPDVAAQRQDALRALSEEINVNSYQTSDGSLQVQVGGGSSLVQSNFAGALSLSDDLSYNGIASIKIKLPNSNTSLDITANTTGGRLGGELIDRNTTLNTQIGNLDQLAYQIATQFNTIHKAGYGLATTSNPVHNTGNNFFANLTTANSAATNIQLDYAVQASNKDGINNIAAAQTDPTGSVDPSGSGLKDGRQATALAKLQDQKTMASNTQTFAQTYGGLVANVGILSSSIQTNFKNQQSLLSQVKIQRESVSGVNENEEGADIIRFQKAFQASSRIMQLADSLMDDLLKI